MLVSQDVIRREILYIKDKMPSPTKTLIEQLVQFGLNDNRTVIVEGILSTPKYGKLLHRLAGEAPHSSVYYFDIPFEETLRRHATKPNAHEFGEAEMKRWWIANDFLGITGEKTIDETMQKDEIVAMILQELEYK